MKNRELFRTKAQLAKKESKSPYGDVLLFLPKSYSLLVGLILISIFSIIGLLVFGTYTKRVTVQGELFSNLGAVPIYLPRAGVIKKYFVTDDNIVKEGDALLEISTDFFGSSNRGISSETLNFLNERKEILHDKIEIEKISCNEVVVNFNSQIASINKERMIIKSQLEQTKEKNDLIEATLKRYGTASKLAAISNDAVSEKKVEFLNGLIDYKTKNRELEILNRNIIDLTFLKDKTLKDFQSSELSIKLDLLTLEEQILNTEYQKGIIVRAPVNGNITAIQGFIGSYINNNKPVFFILSDDSKIEARLLVPGSAIGFVKKGDIVFLRYSAFPYQKFGQGRGIVYSISGTSLATDEIMFETRQTIAEPMFIVKVEIDSQSLNLNNNIYRLKPGLKVDADIMLEEYKLFQWILSPLYALSQKLK